MISGLTACSEKTTTTPAEEVAALGPFAVGYYETQLSYAPVAGEAPRRLDLRIWYPAQLAGEGLADYRVGGIVSVDHDLARAVPRPAPGGAYPLVVYSHGFGGNGLLAYPYAERFASHGWVLVAPDHRGNTTLDFLDDTTAPLARVNVDRPHDVSAVIDAAAAGFDGPLEDLSVGTDRVFVMGHSYGAFTSFAAAGVDLDVMHLEQDCAQVDCDLYAEPDLRAALGAFGDPRVAAIAPQAPSIVEAFVEGALPDLEVPVLLQSARRDVTTPHFEQAVPTWDGLDHPEDVWLQLPEGGHLSFVSICDDLSPALLEAAQPGAQEDGCGPDFPPVATTVPLLVTHTLGFARLHVLGEERFRSLFDAPALDAVVTLTRHP